MKMNRIAAAMLAAVIAFGMVSCGNVEDKAADAEAAATTTAAAAEGSTEETPAEETAEETKADEASAAEEKIEEAAEETAEEVEKTAEEAEAEETAAAEEEPPAEEESAEGTTYEDGVVKSKYYTMEVDEGTWAQTAQAGVDMAFILQSDKAEDQLDATANFSVVSMGDAMFKELTAEDYAKEIETAYSSMENFELMDSGFTTLDGREVYSVKVGYDIQGFKMIISQLIYCEDGQLIVFSYGAVDSSIEKIQPEFDKVINSFKFL